MFFLNTLYSTDILIPAPVERISSNAWLYIHLWITSQRNKPSASLTRVPYESKAPVTFHAKPLYDLKKTKNRCQTRDRRASVARSFSRFLRFYRGCATKNQRSRLVERFAIATFCSEVIRTHPCPGNRVEIKCAVVYHDWAAHAFSAGIKYRHCTFLIN